MKPVYLFSFTCFFLVQAYHAFAQSSAAYSFGTGAYDGATLKISTVDHLFMAGNMNNEGWIAEISTAGYVAWEKRIANLSVKDIKLAESAMYITGSFKGTVTIGTVSLTCADAAGDMFLAKLDYYGNCIWAKRGGSSDPMFQDVGGRIFIDERAHIYVAGSFRGNAVFAGTTLTDYGEDDFFLLKYNPDGSLLWAKSGGSIGIDGITDITCIDADQSVLVTGYIQEDAEFGNGIMLGGEATFMLKYDSTGKTIWVKDLQSASPQSDASYMVQDAATNIYVLSNGNLVKFTAGGKKLWEKAMPFNTYSRPKLQYQDGYLYLFGSFTNQLTLGTALLISQGNSDVFFSRMDTAGNFTGAKSFGGPGYDVASSLGIESGNVWIAGTFSDSMLVGNTMLTSAGAYDVFLARFPLTTVGIHEAFDEAPYITIYPNPSANYVRFSKPADYAIYDLHGNKVSAAKQADAADISTLAKGIYVVRINNRLSRKLIKE